VLAKVIHITQTLLLQAADAAKIAYFWKCYFDRYYLVDPPVLPELRRTPTFQTESKLETIKIGDVWGAENSTS